MHNLYTLTKLVMTMTIHSTWINMYEYSTLCIFQTVHNTSDIKWTLLTNQLYWFIFRYCRSELQCHIQSSPILPTMRPENHCRLHPCFQTFPSPCNGNSIDSTNYWISNTYLTTKTSQFLKHALCDTFFRQQMCKNVYYKLTG